MDDLLTEEQVEELAKEDLHAALVEPNASIGLLMNCLYTCLETIQENASYPLLLLENLEFAQMVGRTIEARKERSVVDIDRCAECDTKEFLRIMTCHPKN